MSSKNPLTFSEGWTSLYKEELDLHSWGWFQSPNQFIIWHREISDHQFSINKTHMDENPSHMMSLLVGWMHQVCDEWPCGKRQREQARRMS